MGMMDKALFNLACVGDYSIGYGAKGTGIALEYTGAGIKKLGEFVESQGKNLHIYGEKKILAVSMGRKFLSGELTEEEMKQYLSQHPELKKALEDKARTEQSAPAPKATATPKGEVDPANGVMKNYSEGDEMSPADCAEAFC
jgi:hypothetical protein